METINETPDQQDGFESHALQILESIKEMRIALHEAVQKPPTVVNNVTISGPIGNYNAHVEKIVITNNGKTVFDEESNPTVSPKSVAQAIKQCSEYMWGYSAYAVPFCVCRDKYGWQDNATNFERVLRENEIDIPEGTVNNTIKHNEFMRMNVDKWNSNCTKARVLKLLEAFTNTLENKKINE